MATNRERQVDEIEAISSICEEQEFFKLSSQEHELALNVSPAIEKGVLDIKYSNVILKHTTSQTYRHFSVKNLPASYLRLNLPPEYPELAPPRYILEINWLSPWECSRVCLRLDELWEENKGYEILFVWRDFLQNGILDFLNHKECLDVSFLFAIYDEPYDRVTIALLELVDDRVRNGALFVHPMRYLTQYDESRRRVDFSKAIHICGICLEESSGQRCTQFHDCGHIYCKTCTAEYFTIKINEGKGGRILCPDHKCYRTAQIKQIKEICPDLYRKYEEFVLVDAVSKMNDVVLCPRKTCQTPVIAEVGETLATCCNCSYNFCVYCRKVYHGVAPCIMTPEDSMELVKTYVKANKVQKQQLLKKYGRRQIQSVVEEQLTKEYMKDNTKPCPECQIPIAKTNGCNKMRCVHCRANFCWLCGLRITTSNAYDHFATIDKENACFGRLFEGMPGAEDDLPDNNE